VAAWRREALSIRPIVTAPRIPELSLPPKPALSRPQEIPAAENEKDRSRASQVSIALAPTPAASHPTPSPAGAAPAASGASSTEPAYQTVEAVYARRLEGREPAFPSAALKAEVEGTVVAKIVIGPEGKVAEITMLQSHPAFERVVRDTVTGWRFRPHLVGGRPASVYTTIRFTFKLE
jgi:protein TonB